MNRLLLFLVFCISISSFAQCPSGDVELTTHAEVDAFLAMYPSCTQISGDLEIGLFSGSNISDVSALSNIVTLTGDLWFWNTNIVSLSGWNMELTGTGIFLRVWDNPLLTSLDGISVGASGTLCGVSINDSDNLASIAALSGAGFTGGNCGISIRNNSSLSNLSGLEGFTNASAANVEILDNAVLTDISGLINLSGVIGGTLVVSNNPLLSDISSLQGVTDVIGKTIDISSNPLLITLNGLQNITNLGVSNPITSLFVSNNSILNDISALESIDPTSILDMSISNNPNLMVCDNDFICGFLAQGGSANITTNAAGCNSVAQVEAECNSACPTMLITLSSQADIDAFPANYPGCTNVENGILISGTDITDLTPLSVITSIGYLGIVDNPLLTSLDGLQNVTTLESPVTTNGVSLNIQNNPLLQSLLPLSAIVNTEPIDIVIEDNAALLSFQGLEGLTGVVFTFFIENNDMITNFVGLSGIENVDDFFVQNNASLLSFEGLDALVETGAMNITNNDLLVSLDFPNLVDPLCGFDIVGNASLDDIDGFVPKFSDLCGLNFTITNNPSLSNCAIAYVCDALPDADTVTIANNAAGCNSQVEVETNCSTTCPSAEVVLSSQVDVDSFSTNFSGCTDLGFPLVISGSDIQNLNGLSQIESVSRLEISNNPLLEFTSGLNDIAIVDNGQDIPEIVVENNPALEGMAGLFSFGVEVTNIRFVNNPSINSTGGFLGVTSLSEDLIITDNSSIQSLSGFSNITTGNISKATISNNSQLTDITVISWLKSCSEGFEFLNNDAIFSLEGLENLASESPAGPFSIRMEDNDNLGDISALEIIDDLSLIDSWVISGNANLSVCNIQSVCQYIEENRNITIDANATGCNDVPEVEVACGLSTDAVNRFPNISVYPNPVTNTLRVALESNNIVHSITLYSLLGEAVLVTSTKQIDLSTVSSGMYFLSVVTTNGTVTKKIVKK